ncbi:hypothetical protein HYH03_008863 [Edaphochlamys debaryana]|uniref:FAD-binding domain-containing protein n=1 Tax=Edaphochlamys debaryana TaxID=47281 RepID=A0A836BXW2_9CHLO|nr:hypothetical protein HYH03_008863 [Edaphochlamys debaryana]|eukprot:KAG2492955.1 hypothetical protein HYH03_008863 [Edaphochlamys debaryana]
MRAAAATGPAETQPPVLWDSLDVAIIGGGPAGLATAIALRSVMPNLKLKVFEAGPEATQQGAGVGLYANGARALEALDPRILHELVSRAVYTIAFAEYNDITGKRWPHLRVNKAEEALERLGYAPCVAPWSSLRDALRARVPQGVLEFGCRVTHCSGPGLEGWREELAARAQEPQGAEGESAGNGANGAAAAPAVAGAGVGAGADGEEEWYTLRIAQLTPDASTGGAAGGNGTKGAQTLAPPPPGTAAGSREVAARARFVIAADGYFSRTRRTVADGKAPVFLGSVRWLGSLTEEDFSSGRVPLPAAIAPRELWFHTWMQAAADGSRPPGMGKRGLNVYATSEEGDQGLRLVWSLYAPTSALAEAGLAYPMPRAGGQVGGSGSGTASGSGVHTEGSGGGGGPSSAAAATESDDSEPVSVQLTQRNGSSALARALAVTSYLPADVRAMLAATPPERVGEFGLHMQPEETYVQGAWARGGLLLLGDAAHNGPPNGQGANLAFEDAAVLGALVRRKGLSRETFAAWEAERLPRVKAIMYDKSPGLTASTDLIQSTVLEPLWSPGALAAEAGEGAAALLPSEVAAEVKAALAAGQEEEAKQAVIRWSRARIKEIVGSKLAGRVYPEAVAPPPGTQMMR